MSELKAVFRTSNLTVLHMARGLLESGDIPVRARGEGLQSLIGLGMIGGYNVLTGPIELVVPAEYEEEALALLKSVEDEAS